MVSAVTLVGAEEQVQIEIADRGQEAERGGNGSRDGEHHERLPRALADALKVARAEVLRDEARHRSAKSVEQRHQGTCEFVGRAEAVLCGVGDHLAVQNVKLHNNTLHNNDADGQHRKLQPERDALKGVLADVVPRDGPVLAVEPELWIAGEGIAEAAVVLSSCASTVAMAAPRRPSGT